MKKETKLKNYCVAVELSQPVVYGLFHVEAKNKKEAIQKAKETKIPNDFDVTTWFHNETDFEKVRLDDVWEE